MTDWDRDPDELRRRREVAQRLADGERRRQDRVLVPLKVALVVLALVMLGPAVIGWYMRNVEGVWWW